MSVELADSDVSEGVENNEAQNDSRETNDNVVSQPSKPAGYDPVDLSDLPPEKQDALNDRIKYLYSQVKDNERKFKSHDRTLNEYRTIAQQQAQQIDDLMNGVGQVVDHLHNKNIGETEAQLQKKMQDAFDSGDNQGYVKAQDDLNKLRLQQALKQQKQPQKPQNNTQKQAHAGYQSANQMANEAAQDGEITQEQATIVSSWQEETDDRGQPLRPWAVNSSSDPEMPDPDFVKANLIALRVFKSNPNRSVEENLAEVDRQMGVKKSNGKQTVMGGSLTTPSKQSRITLTPEMQKLAVRTKFGGSKAKTDAEHIEAYRKQIEQVRSSKRSH